MNLANQEFEATAEQYRLLGPQGHQPGRPEQVRPPGLQDRGSRGREQPDEEHHGEIVGLAEAGVGNNIPSVRGTGGRLTTA